MKKINVFWNDKKLCQIYPHATKFQVFKWKLRKIIRKTVIASFAVGLLYGMYNLGAYFTPKIVYATVEKPVEVEKDIPVLEKIKQCESGGTQYAKNGQVLIKVNTNKTVDIGIMQINSVWFAKAHELGYDLTKQDDNIAFGKWLFENYGSSPWGASQKCWMK